MTIIEVTQDRQELSYRQRWGHYFVFIFGLISLALGINLRDSALYAVTLYSNSQAGIRARYPENWLIDEGGQNYIFRVRDSSNINFKTTIQVGIRPISPSTTARNVFDALSLSRAPTLAAYTVLSIEPYILPNEETEAVAMNYYFVSEETNPFLESVPVVITGQDILTIQRDQAIIITFLSESQTYNQNRIIFERFLQSLEF